jgi:hypothetical protein
MYIAPIIQCYIVRNFAEFSSFLETIFTNKVNPIEANIFSYRNIPSQFFGNTNVIPVYPRIKREVIPTNPNIDKLDDCCNDRDGDKGLDSEGVSELLKSKNIENHTRLVDNITPSILIPVFDTFKDQFEQCTSDIDFLGKLFNMYSGRSIKFMQQIRLQFSSEQNGLNDYIERYVLTKHPYSVNLITECIKHAADIKFTLSRTKKIKPNTEEEPENKNTEEEPENKNTDESIDSKISQYALFLMYTCATKHEIDTKDKTAFVDFIKTEWSNFKPTIENQVDQNDILNIEEDIINNISAQEIHTYNRSLYKLFSIHSAWSRRTFLVRAKKP